MRVLNVVSIFSAREGAGNAERTAQLTRAIQSGDVSCTVLTLDIGRPEDRVADIAGASLIVLPCLSSRFQIPRGGWRKVVAAVRDSEVVHLMGYWTVLGAMAYLAARRHGVPYVVSPAGALPIFGRSRWLKRIYNLIVGRSLIRHASGWIAVTTAEFPHFEAYGIPRSRVTVISNGVWESDFPMGDGDEFFRATGISRGPFVLFVGRLNPIKGPDLLLEAFGQLAEEFPEFRLVFAGPDEGMQAVLEARIRDLGLSDRVIFCGFVSGQMKMAAYKAARLLVVPSRSEAMSLVAVEAGICGTPVLMTDQCGLNELGKVSPGLIVAASIDGLTAGLRFALANPVRLAEWGEGWRSIVRERFLWRNLAKQFTSLLEEVAYKKAR
jgi:glycosyltransferase involved in cell wall biosynthesis